MKDETMDDIDAIAKQWDQLGLSTDYSAWQSIARILRISKLLETRLTQLHSQFDLKLGEFDVLAALKRANGAALTPSQLYQTMLLSSGAMTSRLDRLETRQLINRHHCDQDRRSIKVSLTPEGKSLIDTVYPAHFKLIETLLAPMSETDKNDLAGLLKISLKHIANEQENGE